MRSLLSSAALLCLTSFANAVTHVRKLEEVQCEGHTIVELQLKKGRLEVPGVVSMDSRLYYLNGKELPSFPAPVIRMRAGKTCSIKVVNMLNGTKCEGHANGFHCLDTTNLHTHGLHVSPYEDNIDTHLEPNGDSRVYHYNLPEEHLMGTHWYHAHHHGSTAVQVGGGLAGILLVEPSYNYSLPADLDELYNDERVPPLIFSHMQLNGTWPWPPVLGPGGIPDRSLWDDLPTLLSHYPENNIPMNAEWYGNEEAGGNFYTVNGQYNPTVTVTAGVATLLRMVHAGGNAHLALTLDEPEHCQLMLIARDGVFHRLPYLKLEEMVFVNGGRSDFAVLCNESAAGKTINVAAGPDRGVQPNSRFSHSQAHVFQLYISARSDVEQPRPFPTSEATLPHHFTALMDGELEVQKGGETGVEVFDMRGQFNIGINEVSFKGWDGETYVEEFCLDKAYEIQIGDFFNFSDTTNLPPVAPSAMRPDHILIPQNYHTYHHHVNHFLCKDPLWDPTGAVVREGEWRDTIPVWGMKIHFYPVRYVGEVVAHCHELQHEDKGLMALMLLKNCGVKPHCTHMFVEKDAHKYDISHCSKVMPGYSCVVKCNWKLGYQGLPTKFYCPIDNTSPDMKLAGDLPECTQQ